MDASQPNKHLDAREPEEKDSLVELYNAINDFQVFFEGRPIRVPGDIETHIVPRTEEFIELVYRLNDAIEIFQHQKQALLYQFIQQDIENPSSDFFRIKGLVMHDISKSFSIIMGYIDLAKWACVDGKIIPEEYDYLSQYIPSILNVVQEAKSMLEMLAKYRAQRSVSSTEVLRAIGLKENERGEYINVSTKAQPLTVTPGPDFDTQHPELAFTLSTLILNARSAGASQIRLALNNLTNGVVLKVSDNAEGNKFPDNYLEDLKKYFEDGMRTPIDELTESSGGGKLSAFLAGQRYALMHPLAKPAFYNEYFAWEEPSEEDSNKLKGLVIFFPRETIDYSLNDMGLNYYSEKVSNIISMTHENGFKESYHEEIAEFVSQVRESLAPNKQNIFTLISTSNREVPIKTLTPTIEAAVRNILTQLDASSEFNWDLVITLLHILKLTISIYFENNISDYSKLKTLVDPFIDNPIELSEAA